MNWRVLTMSDLDHYLTDEVVERAAKAMADDWDPERYPVLAAMFRDYAQTALSAVLPDIIWQAKAEALAEGDGYHTHEELYEYRMLYNALAANAMPDRAVKSWRHSDGEMCFGGGWFVVYLDLPTGQVSNHYKAEFWDMFDVPEVDLAPEYDGHTPAEAANRLRADIIRQAKAEAGVVREVEPTLQAMLEYGSAIRGDWSDFDGRSMKAIIEDWVQEILAPDPSHTAEWHRRDLGMCMAGGGHWCGRWGYCDDECGCEPCTTERGERNE